MAFDSEVNSVFISATIVVLFVPAAQSLMLIFYMIGAV